MDWSEALRGIADFNRHYAMGEDEQHRLYDIACTLPEGGRILEIGVCHGSTSGILAYVAYHRGLEYHGIDPFVLEGNEATFRASMDALGYPYNIHVEFSQEYDWQLPLDLLLIDGDHDEWAVRDDCIHYIPFVKPGGYVAFDDWSQPGESLRPQDNAHWGITLNGRHFTKGFEDLGMTGRMQVYRKPLTDG